MIKGLTYKFYAIRCLLILFVLLTSDVLSAQQPYFSLELEGESARLKIERNGPQNGIDSVLSAYGFEHKVIDSIWKAAGRASASEKGWKIDRCNDDVIELIIPISEVGKGFASFPDIVLADADFLGIDQPVPVFRKERFGVNNFKKLTVRDKADGKTVFWLPNDKRAERVYLSGSFNNWSTGSTPMTKTDSGWVVEVKLREGPHQYKFIVDGFWKEDPNNEIKIRNEHHTYNSIYYKPNYLFELDDFHDARKVSLAGSFNNWNKRKIQLYRENGRWILPAYVKEGTYTYKYIVDGVWRTDPTTSKVRLDGKGNLNSYFSIGDTMYFKLDGYKNAEHIYVAGQFNNWQSGELEMLKSPTGWELPYVLAPGNYQYKFVVDGDWILDPANPKTGVDGNHENSFLVVNENHQFVFEAPEDVRDVRISGSFNHWSESGIPMQKEDGVWKIGLHLEPGKHLYKFLVDGKWLVDPANPLWEQNLVGTGNSVVWIEPEPIN